MDVPWRESAVARLSAAELTDRHAAVPVGAMTRQGTTHGAPVRIPDLIGVERRPYLDATGLVRHRGIGDLMRYAALNQGVDVLARSGDLVPATLSPERPEPGASAPERPEPGPSAPERPEPGASAET